MLLIVYLISLIHPILKNLFHLIFYNDLFLFLIVFLLFFQVILTFNIFYDPPSFLIILKNSYMQILDIDLLYKLNFNYLYNWPKIFRFLNLITFLYLIYDQFKKSYIFLSFQLFTLYYWQQLIYHFLIL